MRVRKAQLLLLALLLQSYVPPGSAVQAGGDNAVQTKRQKAMDLFNQGQRLQALSLLEEVAQGDPKDGDVLVALAASLVDHAATLTDPAATAKERFRARDLLQKATDLGNTSVLAQSLLQLLAQLPENGVIKFSDNPAVEQVMNAGEAAFARRDFDEALKQYAKALEIEPTNYSAALFMGNTFDKMNAFAKAGEWYEKAMKLDPNVETAYRYYADMLAREGDMAKSRTMLIQAAVAEPYNKIVWRELRAWATINKTQINFIFAGMPPDPSEARAQGYKLDDRQLAEISAAWTAYRAVKARWQSAEFRKRFPQETEYRHTLAEESEALTAEAEIIRKLKESKATSNLVVGDQALSLVLKLYESKLIEPYVLFSLGDEGIARDYAGYRIQNRAKLEEFMDKFVVPPSPVKH
jgi:Flp pilus assembly protein TadD